MNDMEHIDLFDGEYCFLSNFYPAVIEFEGQTYGTVEAAYQAAKTLNLQERELIRQAATPGRAKRLGRKVSLRPDWEDVKVNIMLELLRKKFSHPDLRQKLVGTGDAQLTEGNNHGDRFWGQVDGVGRNQLGLLLMQVRTELQLHN